MCNPATAEADNTSYNFMVDNAVSALAKIIIFQNDGSLVTDDHTKHLLEQLPLKIDIDEARLLHHLVLSNILEKNAALLKFPEELKAAMKRIEECSNSHPGESEDVLGDQSKLLFSQIISQM